MLKAKTSLGTSCHSPRCRRHGESKNRKNFNYFTAAAKTTLFAAALNLRMPTPRSGELRKFYICLPLIIFARGRKPQISRKKPASQNRSGFFVNNFFISSRTGEHDVLFSSRTSFSLLLWGRVLRSLLF